MPFWRAPEGQAEKAVAALQKLSSLHARVLRGGRQELIDSELLVPGDVVLLEAGDLVPADIRLKGKRQPQGGRKCR